MKEQKIILLDERTKDYITKENIKRGDLFEYNNDIYMYIGPGNDYMHAIGLNDKTRSIDLDEIFKIYRNRLGKKVNGYVVICD